MTKPRVSSPLRVAVLISGGGTTLENLLAVIARGELAAEIVAVVSSHPAARGLSIAQAAGIPTQVVAPRDHTSLAAFSEATFAPCRTAGADVVAMGGYLKLVAIPADFSQRVFNIHPSLIPAFCGQGFFGRHVHEAVLAAGVRITGCTVHFVDNQYDHGPIVCQQPVPVLDDDTPASLAARVFAAECQLYPQALAWYAAGRLSIEGRRVRVLPAPAGS